MNGMAGKRVNTRMKQVFTLADLDVMLRQAGLLNLTFIKLSPQPPQANNILYLCYISRDISLYKWKYSCPTRDPTLVAILIVDLNIEVDGYR